MEKNFELHAEGVKTNTSQSGSSTPQSSSRVDIAIDSKIKEFGSKNESREITIVTVKEGDKDPGYTLADITGYNLLKNTTMTVVDTTVNLGSDIGSGIVNGVSTGVSTSIDTIGSATTAVTSTVKTGVTSLASGVTSATLKTGEVLVDTVDLTIGTALDVVTYPVRAIVMRRDIPELDYDDYDDFDDSFDTEEMEGAQLLTESDIDGINFTVEDLYGVNELYRVEETDKDKENDSQ
jgi:hypothetical protein